MKYFINNSASLRDRILFLESHFSKIQLSPTLITTNKCLIPMPPFTNATFCATSKAILQIIQSKEFEIENNCLKYKIITDKGICIQKSVELDQDTVKPFMVDDYAKFELEEEVAKYLSKIKDFKYMKFSSENENYNDSILENNKENTNGKKCFSCAFATIKFDETVGITIYFPCDIKFKPFKLRCKDLWFLNDHYHKVVICVSNFAVYFCLYDNDIVTIFQVEIVF
ncbi:hypothetical protein EDEG_03476 [Edhazardia aedis USNM 41457]|uniref:Uncharacterized protein n=1 Tax=Edhazardia aedis (strain USNM 41457) TaxID=1003232 RepID=J9D3F6_EDHAE|nr:hypothetical protein EDEG_03476 [Edhazardia aedis USNM 41457]|eukprot:EJW02074.1 hypothetical protein EDEG_03476 [Edhazardia aedis USNM 41457]